jgi:hypothetical protein
MLAALAGPGCLTTADGGGGVDGVTSVDDDGGASAEYPAGPYGNEVGEVFPRMTFLDESGAVVDLADDFEGPLSARVLFSTTMWCTPCIPDAEYLATQLAEKHPSAGGLGSIFEGLDGAAPDIEDAALYNQEVETFEFVADVGQGIHDVFPVGASLPRVVVLRTDTMQIAHVATGHDMDAVLDAVVQVEASN